MEGKVTGSPGFFSYIIGAVDPETGSGWGVEEIWAESSVLVVAGKHTTSTYRDATSLTNTEQEPIQLSQALFPRYSTYYMIRAKWIGYSKKLGLRFLTQRRLKWDLCSIHAAT